MTELTTDNALRLGVEAYKLGRFRDADFYYTLILKSIPDHPEANHNMGVLAITLVSLSVQFHFSEKRLRKIRASCNFGLA